MSSGAGPSSAGGPSSTGAHQGRVSPAADPEFDVTGAMVHEDEVDYGPHGVEVSLGANNQSFGSEAMLRVHGGRSEVERLATGV